MATKNKEIGWAIASPHGGFYVDWRHKRIDMIAQHVHDMRLVGDPEVPEFAPSGGLSPEQKALWNRRKRAGDRCVKVQIREL